MRLSAGYKIDGVDCRSVSDEDLSETYGIVDVGRGLVFPCPGSARSSESASIGTVTTLRG